MDKEKLKEYRQKYKEKNKEKIKQQNSEYYLLNKEIIDKRNIEYFLNHKDILKEKQKKYNLINNEKIKEKRKEYEKNNKDLISEKNKIRYEKTKERHHELVKKWKIEHKEEYNNYRKLKAREDRKNKPYLYAWRDVLKGTLRRMGKKKEGLTVDILGYSSLDLKHHIEQQFKNGMTWYNYGEWEIDHIKEVCTFDKNTPQNIVNNLSNLQPLWKKDNLQKWFMLKNQIKHGK